MKKLKAEKRKVKGKKNNQIKSEGYIPCVIYNNKGESVDIKAPLGDVVKVLTNTTSTTIIDVEVEKDSYKALVKEVSKNPKTDNVQHVSFFAIDEKTPQDFTVPFTLTGVSPAVRNNLGVLVQPTTSIEVRCLLKDLPEDIKVAIDELDKPGETIIMSDLTLPEGVALIREEDNQRPVVTITQIQKEEEIEEKEEETDEELEGEEGEGVEGEEGEEGEGVESEEGDKKEGSNEKSEKEG